ncbi:MAG: hypothetical protein LUD72_08430 [Bacteroidales bacterium]|nr:hypothetical protein [Bacteroidales bacterium]
MVRAGREANRTNSEAYKERFQFVLHVNDNVACQRYFKVRDYDPASVGSDELRETMDDIVYTIQRDTTSKSRVYTWYVADNPIKLTGFVPEGHYRDYLDGEYQVEETWVSSQGLTEDEMFLETQRPDPWTYTFKFSLVIDDNPVYEYIWDGNVYPKYIRNSIDLSNTDAPYRNRDASELPFSLSLLRSMTSDKDDLIWYIIKTLSNAMRKRREDEKPFTMVAHYGDRTYPLDKKGKAYTPKSVIEGWRIATKEKTDEYFGRNSNRKSTMKVN